MVFEVRVAVQGDLEALLNLDKECFPIGNLDLEPAPVGEIEEGVEQGCIFVAEQKGKVIGMLQVDKVSSNNWELLTLAILPSHRGSGIGRGLMEKLVLELDKSPYLVAVSCLTSPNNLIMQSLLEGFGFIQVGLVENHYGPGKHRLKFQLN